MTDKLRDWLTAYFPCSQTESPVESLLWAGWEMMKHRLMLPPEGVRVTPQQKLGKYRADFVFLVTNKDGKPKSLVVEVDGHDFHERTKDQAARDRSRDRWMAENGYDVMRFTGSEVWANPFACAIEIAERLHILRYGTTRQDARIQAALDSIRAMIEAD